MALLEIVSGIDSGVAHELKTRETVIGRHSDCQIVLRDSTVSRHHARIRQDGDHYVVDDMDSQHGTRVNGETVRMAVPLRNGDEISLSQIRIVFRTLVEDADSDDDRPSTIITSLDVLRSAGVDKDSQNASKWRALLEITRALGVSLELQEILPNVLENIFQILPQASRGCILLADPANGRLQPFAAKPPLGKKDEPPPISRTISESVMSQTKAVLSTDAGADERFAASDSVMDLKMRSVMCAPLIGSLQEPFGMIHLDAQDPAAQFTVDDLDILINIANLVGQAVDHARLHETQMEFAKRERDMDTARQVQTHFLPQERPTIEGYQVFDYYEPTEQVGGDYFGYTWLPDGRLAIAVGDVAGHGVPAALLMARLCSEARYSLVTDIIPSEAIDSLNRELCKTSFTYFITFALCVLDFQRHELTIVNAGHMPPMCRRAESGEIESLCADASCPPLGIEGSITYREDTVQLQPGDIVLLYTDGVSEAPSARGDRYGIDRIAAVLAQGTNAVNAGERLLREMTAFSGKEEQEDDVCIVAFSRNTK
ncbi:MAG: SpoIIE family protein phosphatase [Pirellulaceae bacterium]|jgi:serine phosphatase RsbU (regulator of sigma subunit)/pSer/pThr/pTyr-binding forkhead associated (FHA) protein|nr:SpoIIE family protein phosphatase [Pirellulaceae bacterium]HJN10066.1 SpoIIE family protein phosphatase [Pirellulaceae bacterium]